MSKALFICYRNKSIPKDLIKTMGQIQKEILPDNITPNPLDLKYNNGSVSCIFNPVELEQRNNESICLGFTSDKSWWEIQSKKRVLEGSYSIFRNDSDLVELQTDAVASRTIWYYFDDDLLIASNSQLAILYYLGDFNFNNEVVPWMLASGIIGPGLSWDKRIKCLKPQSILSLDKKIWLMDIWTEAIDFTFNDMGLTDDQYLEELSSVLTKSIQSLPFQASLLLPLSGGYDSRGILLSLNDRYNYLTTVTWGNKLASKNENSDAYIAKKLANFFKVKHKYLLTENPKLEPQKMIDRFLINSEGRIDHIAGYMDGFEIWADIFKTKCSAIIRGDEGFGWSLLYSEKQARTSCGLYLMEDFDKLKDLGYQHKLPQDFEKKSNESSEEWRDRLYHTFRLPTILGALNETKTSYVEVLNPLLSYSILKFVRTLPDRLRTDKNLFKKSVDRKTPDIPFATEAAISDYRDLLKKGEFINYFIETIRDDSDDIIHRDFVNTLIERIQTKKKSSIRSKFLSSLKKKMPNILKGFLKAKIRNLNQMDDSLLLFRVFIIFRMNQKINHSIRYIKSENSNIL